MWHAACDVLNGKNAKEVFDMLAVMIPEITNKENAGTPFMADESILGITEAYIKADASAISRGIVTKIATALNSKGLPLSELLKTAVSDDYDATAEYKELVAMTDFNSYNNDNEYNYNYDYDYNNYDNEYKNNEYSDYYEESDYNDYYDALFAYDNDEQTATCPSIRDTAESICRGIVYPTMSSIWSTSCGTSPTSSDIHIYIYIYIFFFFFFIFFFFVCVIILYYRLGNK